MRPKFPFINFKRFADTERLQHNLIRSIQCQLLYLPNQSRSSLEYANEKINVLVKASTLSM